MTPVCDPKPYRVTAVTGSMITASRSGHSVTRNSVFKMIPRTLLNTQQQDQGSSDDGDLGEGPPIAPAVKPPDPAGQPQQPRRNPPRQQQPLARYRGETE